MAMLLADPFDTLLEFQRTLDSFRSSGWLGAGLSAGGAYPPMNVFRRGDDIVAIVEVPGVHKSDLDIKVERNTLRISGSKAVKYSDKAAIHRRERLAGRFDRAVTLPIEIDADKIRAECRDGILALYLPRAERDKPRSIVIS
jgi:HSP20 family protein